MQKLQKHYNSVLLEEFFRRMSKRIGTPLRTGILAILPIGPIGLFSGMSFFKPK